MSTRCGPGCGYCGRCTAAWEDNQDREDDSDGRCPTCGVLGNEPCADWCGADSADNLATERVTDEH